MSTKPNQTKYKLSEVAKDLKITNQELIDFISDKLGSVKKPSACLNQDEMNYILEYYSQNNQVDSFNPYFESRNSKPEPIQEEKTVQEKKPAKKEKTAKPAVTKQTEKKVNADKNAEIKEVQQNKPSEKAVEKAVNNKPAAVPQKSEQKSALERFNNQIKKTDEKKNQPVKQETKKQENKPNEVKSTKTKLGGNFTADGGKVEQKMRTVDTRGSYVDIDKYNEKYENIAPVAGGGSGKRGKDNFSKKQKLTQKSAQRNKQQYSNKKETEAEKLRRLELERARKQQLKVLIPDEIVVSELASRLKVTATEVIKKLMGLGEMCTINQVIDFDTASLVAEELGAKVEKEVIITIEERLIDDS
ncbi:MAG: translation initiation factor IF-2 N-terminal domain-containing protein, partial [Oscillospiraceae bacterium]|nr:translation initiation factor IF-2 N-terminal domain-containing protein [Oscillospiraceae bacterium]